MSLFNQIVPTLTRTFTRREQANGTEPQPEYTLKPAYELKENADGWSLVVQLPGVAREGLTFTAEDNQITVRAQRAWNQPEGWTTLHRESVDAPYELVLEHQQNVDVEKIAAELKDGVLRVTLPKTEAVKPRTIAIN
ncbi:MAG TPA: Hsp20/alpha crystallin family protein [Candidatus Didemnitutus sp.]|nr:Hsp20/alpha crystallin family protein [Candidatus Didemnitutus sp.]